MNDPTSEAAPDEQDREVEAARDARDAADVQAVLASAPRIHRLTRILRIAGAVAVALSLLAGLAMAVVMLAKGFGGAASPEPDDAGGRTSGAVRSSPP